ncbi:hypothetical protein [Bradyrhizobium sp. CCGUVB23]|uniref:hypothetical protein n=1 Tax=Bradyrhizobium sp. CCGUVB23 TaxID=2949630 RepID=UPI0020B36317|nr:hypothetical protein [Bradyrhizobium sp. CCGUVB23]MCP3459591.1 hypothetical protein [Bradyrhizobium sp. CCGUVB23]
MRPDFNWTGSRSAWAIADRSASIREQAERRGGQLLQEMAERGERDTGKGNRNPVLKSQAATPADLGITKTQSSRWRPNCPQTSIVRTVALLAAGKAQ